MPDLISDPNMRLLAEVDTLLVILMMTTGNYTSVLRLRRRVFATPEDYKVTRLSPASEPDSQVERSKRIHQNHVENVLPFIAVSFFYTLTQPSHTTLALFLWGFLGARVVYSVCYAMAWQPYRTLLFTIGAVLMFVMAVLTLLAVL